MESLLTPTESLAFQSFLSSVDTSHSPGDWATYSAQFSSSSIRAREHDEIVLDPLPPPSENDSLTQATKDLMSLDAPGWSDAPMMSPHPPMHHHHHQQQMMYDHQMQHHQQHQRQHQQPLLTQPLHRQHTYSSPHDTFPFLNQKNSFQSSNNSPYPQQHNPYGHPNAHQLQQQHQHQEQLNRSHLNSPTSPAEMFAYSSPHHHHQAQVSSLPLLPPSLGRSQSQGSTTSAPSKRPVRSSVSATASSSSATGRQQRVPPSSQQPQQQGRPSQSGHPNGTTATGSSKPALLSPSQKKANHIQSEQKRRANIRRGYEALCETVPALREAIREEEEEARLNAAQSATGAANGKGKAAAKKRAKKKDGEEGGTSARDKIDGRAGPRSENVVLSKTIDYINDLLSERSGLLSRLERARSMLPPGHPGLIPLSPNPPWEREWKGGEGKFGDEEEEAEESEGEADGDDDGAQANGTKTRAKRNGANTG